MPLEGSVFDAVDFLGEERFREGCEEREVQEGEIVVEQGGSGSDLFVVDTGRFLVSDTAGEGFVLATLTGGDVFGEMGFLRGGHRSAEVKAASPGRVLVFSREAFGETFDSDPLLAARILGTLARLLADRLSQADSTLSLLSDNSEARERYEVRRLMREMKISIHRQMASEGEE
jgi:CRP-like cAMP-binding protein